ncbi:metalloendopeptidase [Coemansia biformis]|uniref:Metalloendopeptidase n=1 Tax=Coemansia biformis TaxID=1286918 RepID=A0A9W7YC04_9FUNG|nr:metalloendopeptidase [Coemansia biformis]
MVPAAPIKPINFNITPEDAFNLLSNVICKYTAVMDNVAQQTRPTYQNTIVPIAECTNVSTSFWVVSFLKDVTDDERLRKACTRADKRFTEFIIESNMRTDVYKAVRSVYDDHNQLAALSPTERRLVERIERHYRRRGLLISGEKRAVFENAKKRLAEIEAEYIEAGESESARISFSLEELEGMPEEYLCRLQVVAEDGAERYAIKTRGDDNLNAMTFVKSESARKKLYVASGKKCMEDMAWLKEAVELRLQVANALGYQSYAEYVFEERAAGSADLVISMAGDIRKQITSSVKEQMGQLEAAKRADMEAAGEPYSGFFEWDYYYYLGADDSADESGFYADIQAYYPMVEVVLGLLDVYERILGLTIVAAKNGNTWADDVDILEVWEVSECKFVGHLYLDLYHRPGKNECHGTRGIRPSHMRANGELQHPAVALVHAYPKPTSAKPALLHHSDVSEIMSMLGTAFLHLCTSVAWVDLSSPGFDFMSTPGDVLRHWLREPSVVGQIGVHYQTGEPVPEAMLKAVGKSNPNTDRSLRLREIASIMYDIAIHSTTDGSIDVLQIFRDIFEDMGCLLGGEEGVFNMPFLPHLIGGYNVGLYTYLWSDILSHDMYFSRFAKEGLYNRRTGKDFRREILQPGGSRDAMESIRMFLGREPNSNAFLKANGFLF